MYIEIGPVVHEDNESFQFQNDIIRYVYCTGVHVLYGNDRVTKLSVISGQASQVFHVDFFPRLV